MVAKDWIIVLGLTGFLTIFISGLSCLSCLKKHSSIPSSHIHKDRWLDVDRRFILDEDNMEGCYELICTDVGIDPAGRILPFTQELSQVVP